MRRVLDGAFEVVKVSGALLLVNGAEENASTHGDRNGEQPVETAPSREQVKHRPHSLIRNGRGYGLVATASDGSTLYESRLPRREFWLRRAEGGERPWNYVTRFGRRRPLPPPGGGEWRWL
jgi:hypothetical protein